MALKYLEDNYKNGRTPVSVDLLSRILKQSMILEGNVQLSEEALFRVTMLFLASVNYYFYLHPEQYVDFGKFVGYRGVNLKNLWTMEVKEGEDAGSIYEYYKNGGLELDLIEKMVRGYAGTLLQNSTEDMRKSSESVEKLEDLTSHNKVE